MKTQEENLKFKEPEKLEFVMCDGRLLDLKNQSDIEVFEFYLDRQYRWDSNNKYK